MGRLASSGNTFGGSIIAGFIYSIIVAVILSVISGLLFHFTPLAETLLPYFTIGILVLSSFYGGFRGARSVGSRGLFTGLAVGLLLFIVIFALTAVICPEYLGAVALVKKVLACLVAGGCGGVVGVSSA